MTNEYEYIVDGTTGENLAVDRETGEILEAYNALFPYGTQHITPKQQAERRRKAEATKERRIINATIANQQDENKREMGNFFFYNYSSEGEDALQAIMLEDRVKLLFLASYIKYDGTGKLWLTERTPMTRKSAEKELGLKKRTFERFWSRAKQAGLIEIDGDKQVVVSNKIFQRGKFEKGKNFNRKARVYIKAIRSLYRSTPTNKHRYLWFVFGMLPYINLKFNILCGSPSETTIEDIQPLTVIDLCKALHRGTTHTKELREVYESLKFDTGSGEQRFCRIIQDDTWAELIVVNPRVLYMGTSWRDVDVLNALFIDNTEQDCKDIDRCQVD